MYIHIHTKSSLTCFGVEGHHQRATPKTYMISNLIKLGFF